ncbi:MAG: ABC transporter permease [Tannerellaceae bacterium]|jgi:ABC-2 type transport system permease protein|nr:ABC transporter permease [Tannerellaceae bacterium]
MNELIHIIQREYFTRVREKSFILITLLAPFFLSLILLLPIYFSQQHEDYKELSIGLIDNSGKLNESLNITEFKVNLLDGKWVDDIVSLINENNLDGVVYIESSDFSSTKVKYFSKKQPSIYLENIIRTSIRNKLLDNSLESFGIGDITKKISDTERSVFLETVKTGDAGRQFTPYHRNLCLLMGITVYLVIFLFSSQVMRGVLEEKTNKIIELIITSVSPVKFMAGKIIGVALLGLTQIIGWSIILYSIATFLENFASMSAAGQANGFLGKKIDPVEINRMLANLNTIDFNTIIPAFIFFFLGGYLLYSSIFAAIAAVLKHSDQMNQITAVITMPLILAVIVLSNTVNSPDSVLSYWFSIIPFTSPIIMMGRVIYGVPPLDFLISALLLILTVFVIIGLSGKIYKNSILHEGKNLTLTEIISLLKS